MKFRNILSWTFRLCACRLLIDAIRSEEEEAMQHIPVLIEQNRIIHTRKGDVHTKDTKVTVKKTEAADAARLHFEGKGYDVISAGGVLHQPCVKLRVNTKTKAFDFPYPSGLQGSEIVLPEIREIEVCLQFSVKPARVDDSSNLWELIYTYPQSAQVSKGFMAEVSDSFHDVTAAKAVKQLKESETVYGYDDGWELFMKGLYPKAESAETTAWRNSRGAALLFVYLHYSAHKPTERGPALRLFREAATSINYLATDRRESNKHWTDQQILQQLPAAAFESPEVQQQCLSLLGAVSSFQAQVILKSLTLPPTNPIAMNTLRMRKLSTPDLAFVRDSAAMMQTRLSMRATSPVALDNAVQKELKTAERQLELGEPKQVYLSWVKKPAFLPPLSKLCQDMGNICCRNTYESFQSSKFVDVTTSPFRTARVDCLPQAQCAKHMVVFGEQSEATLRVALPNMDAYVIDSRCQLVQV